MLPDGTTWDLLYSMLPTLPHYTQLNDVYKPDLEMKAARYKTWGISYFQAAGLIIFRMRRRRKRKISNKISAVAKIWTAVLPFTELKSIHANHLIMPSPPPPHLRICSNPMAFWFHLNIAYTMKVKKYLKTLRCAGHVQKRMDLP